MGDLPMGPHSVSQSVNPSPEVRRILHVVECFAGGVRTALLQYIRSTPDLEHIILAAYRDEGRPHLSDSYVLVDMAASHRQRVRQVRQLAASTKPDVIHAHSSYGGVYARIASPGIPVVYTPHCYSFERGDVLAVERWAFRTVERALVKRTAVVGACSEYEANLARHLGCEALMIPNVGRFEGNVSPHSAEEHALRRPRVCFSGRLCQQKDPAFAVEVVVDLNRQLGYEVEAVWIGSGNVEMRSRLADNGVRVTGWLDMEGVRAELEASDVYLHSARWEGFPMSILEAQQVGLPIVARRIPSLDGMPQRYMADSPSQMATLVRDLLSSPERVEDCRDQWRQTLHKNSRENQSAMLRLCYGRVCDRRRQSIGQDVAS